MSAAVVTGAGSGIGAAITERLRTEGWDVLTVDIRGQVDLRADLTTRDGNREAVDAAAQRFGGIDAVIPNAGFQHVSPIEEFPEDEWDALIALMLTSPFLLARYAWPYLKRTGRGRFTVIASVHAIVASPYKAAYISAKHGVLGLVKTLALERAPDMASAPPRSAPATYGRPCSRGNSPARPRRTRWTRSACSRRSSSRRMRSSG